MKLPAFITVRSASTRLPEKCFLPFGDCNVLEHVIRRTVHYGLDPIVCTTIEREDDRVVALAEREGIPFFRGSVRHKLKRWRDCCDAFGLNRFHTVDADDPFFDGEEVKKSFALLDEGYDVIFPTASSSAGGASVGFSLTRDVIDKAVALTGDDEDTEMMWYYVEKVPGVRFVKLPDQKAAYQVRLTLDYEEDYWLLRTVQRIVGHQASRQDVDDLFIRNPDLYKINWFRNMEWKANQEAKAI